METGYIKFSDVETDKPIIEVKIVDGTVWMTVNEIADLFGVYTPTVNKYLKAIFKDNLVRENEVTKEYRYSCLEYGECIRIYYNLDIIVCLSFKIQTVFTKIFREWIFRSLYKSTQSYNNLISCESIIKEYSSLNLN
ncbi:hypothetical protein [Dysgonomonas sp. ZJ709]|uniref:hypothetical protein n=1 Tax=Dysgonomonas sp. ZJ709 TaxID=2709797 RepID=UPI0013ECBE9C|nr:hypothetical protein [Dysgonomonas sp. ZJ709]